MTAKRRAAAPEPVADPGRLFSLTEVAERLSVSKRTLWRMIARRELRTVKLGRGQGLVRVHSAELARIMAEGIPPA
jgi:excisionase family DNA binding protein